MTPQHDLERELPAGVWPPEHLEMLGRCPVCNTKARTLLHADLHDRIFFAAAGAWTMWRCERCRSAYLDPRPDEASIGDAYTRYYTHGAPQSEAASPRRSIKDVVRNSLRNGLLGTRFDPAVPIGPLARLAPTRYKQSIVSQFRHLPPLTQDARVLDIGCGDASWLALAHEGGWDATGVEPDDAARLRAPGNVKVFASLVEVEAHQQRFDHITMNHVIEHVHDPVDLLRSCLALLKDGGTIHIETPNIDAPTHERFGPDWRGLEPPRHLVLFTASSLKEALHAAGFNQVTSHERTSPALFLATQSMRIARREDPYAQPTLETDGSLDSSTNPEFLSVSARKEL